MYFLEFLHICYMSRILIAVKRLLDRQIVLILIFCRFLVILGRPDRFLLVWNAVYRIRARVIWMPYLEILTFLAIFT